MAARGGDEDQRRALAQAATPARVPARTLDIVSTCLI
jgi:hypothetical protein